MHKYPILTVSFTEKRLHGKKGKIHIRSQQNVCFRQLPMDIDSSLAILSSIGGCVLNSFIIDLPLKGLTMSICDVAGFAFIGTAWTPLCSFLSALANDRGFP